MKNRFKILFVLVVLLVVSCTKEVIKPNSSNDESFSTKSTSVNPSSDVSKGEPGITDPNNDPDMIIKKIVVIKPH